MNSIHLISQIMRLGSPSSPPSAPAGGCSILRLGAASCLTVSCLPALSSPSLVQPCFKVRLRLDSVAAFLSQPPGHSEEAGDNRKRVLVGSARLGQSPSSALSDSYPSNCLPTFALSCTPGKEFSTVCGEVSSSRKHLKRKETVCKSVTAPQLLPLNIKKKDILKFVPNNRNTVHVQGTVL